MDSVFAPMGTIGYLEYVVPALKELFMILQHRHADLPLPVEICKFIMEINAFVAPEA